MPGTGDTTMTKTLSPALTRTSLRSSHKDDKQIASDSEDHEKN